MRQKALRESQALNDTIEDYSAEISKSKGNI